METKFHKSISRCCSVCKSNDSFSFCDFKDLIPGGNFYWKFETSISICKNCGFTFLSPAPDEEFLNSYYADVIESPSSTAISFNLQKRLKYIKEVSPLGGSLLDYGSGPRNDFHNGLTEHFKEVSIFDKVSLDGKNFRHPSQLEGNLLDVVTLYSSLQYLYHPEENLKELYRSLKPGGIIICEVPNLSFYAQDITGFRLQEHLSHFSIASLTYLFAKAGFELVETRQEASSRISEMLCCFRKTDRVLSVPLAREYETSLNILSQAKDECEKFSSRIDEIYRMIEERSAKGEKTVCWVANGNMRLLFEGRPVPKGVMLIDVNPLKKHAILGAQVVSPLSVKEEIASTNFLICCSKFQATGVYNQFKSLGGPNLNEKDMLIL